MDDMGWIDQEEYPFKSNFMQFDMGRMHYVDEGRGEPVVMLHGNPTWSFLYRHLIKCLKGKYRCVAPDYMGFGLSDKPGGWTYLPKDHAKNIEALIEKLDLKDITLVMQDWGGPIGISYAVNKPENVKRLVIMNTWMWTVDDDPGARRFSKFMGGRLGWFLIRRLNFFVKVIMKAATVKKERLTKHVHMHYKKPQENPTDRKGSWVFPREILGSSQWLGELWSQREKIAGKKAILLWGMKDIAFKEPALRKWQKLLTNCKTVELDNVGHYVQEEMGGELCGYINEIMENG